MEVKGRITSAPDRKYKERMAELQERRRGLQALLSTRVAELKRICLQEAELTGELPSDFPLEGSEKPPPVPRRRGTSRQANRKCQSEEECSQRLKPKKTLFSGALRKHSDPEHNTQTHTHHGKRTVHRGCHTDDTVRSESSSTSDSTGLENDDSVSAPLHVSSGSPVKVFFQNKTIRKSLHIRTDHAETLQTYKPLHLPPHNLPTPPPRSWDSSSGPSDTDGVRLNAACHSNSSDGHLDHIKPLEDRSLMVSGETLPEGPTTTSNGLTEGAEVGRWRGGGYSEVLLDYVWGKQRPPNSQHSIPCNYQVLFNGYSSQQPLGDPPTYRSHRGDQRRVRVTRTKSCGPFLPLQKCQADTHDSPLSAIQPDPHPYLLPPRPPQLPPVQDAQLEETTRSLHKTLALEGLRDWYLRNTKGSGHQNPANGKLSAGSIDQVGVGGALQSNLRTQAVFQQSTYWTETSQRRTLVHSSTFHGQPLQGRSMEGPFYHNSFPPHTQEDQPSPGTLV